MAERVIGVFDQPNRCFTMSEEARTVFAGIQACCNTTSAVRRNKCDDRASARSGTAPWHVSTLAAANLIFEVGIGERTADAGLELQKYHILRAWSQVQMSHALTDMWTQPVKPASPQDDAVASTLSLRERAGPSQCLSLAVWTCWMW